MKKGYWVVEYTAVRSAEAIAAYGAIAMPAIAAGGGVALVRGVPVEVKDNGVKERTVVVEYPSLQAAIDTYNSPAYAEALKALGDTVDRDFRIIEGA